MRPGQDLVIGGFVGLGGTVYAAGRLEERLLRTLPRDFLRGAMDFRRELERRPEESVQVEGGIAVMEPVGEGGILAALWNMARRYGTGFKVYLRRIPIRQETIEICEALGLNPYGLRSGGCTLFAADNGNDILYQLEEAGIRGAVIGKVTEGRDCLLLNGEVRSFLNRPAPDEVEKLREKTEDVQSWSNFLR